MKQIHKNTKSNKTSDTTPIEEEIMEALETCSNHIFTDIINPQQHIVTNLSGRFLVTSNQGNKYLFVPYKYVSNSIMVRPMNSITDK